MERTSQAPVEKSDGNAVPSDEALGPENVAKLRARLDLASDLYSKLTANADREARSRRLSAVSGVLMTGTAAIGLLVAANAGVAGRDQLPLLIGGVVSLLSSVATSIAGNRIRKRAEMDSIDALSSVERQQLEKISELGRMRLTSVEKG